MRRATPATLTGVILSRHAIDADEGSIRQLAETAALSPASFDNAAIAAQLAGGGVEDLWLGLGGIARALGEPLMQTSGIEGSQSFDLALARADIDLDHLVERLSGSEGSRSVSFLFSGPPGTGKSLFARYLADKMELPVLEKRASDLFDKYVGETEKKIAGAFDEALEAGAFLIFDEADSLLGDRRGAVRSWEVSQVNELLTWMERHPLPFCCTTNFAEHLDIAALRRFTFKVAFDVLDERGMARAYEVFFGCSPRHSLSYLTDLTPGDFATVRRRAQALGLLHNDREILKMLESEVRFKTHGRISIGFTAHP